MCLVCLDNMAHGWHALLGVGSSCLPECAKSDIPFACLAGTALELWLCVRSASTRRALSC